MSVGKSSQFESLEELEVTYFDCQYSNRNDLNLQMAGVVKHFVEKNQRVLLIGRVHMEKWRNQYMSYIMKNSSLFLAQNL